MRIWLACVLLLAACPDVTKDSGEGQGGPYVEFDPTISAVPFPNNLALDFSQLPFRVNLPAGACESPTAMGIRIALLNRLDGFGTYEVPISFTLSEPADPTSIEGNVFLYKRAPVASTTPIPTVAFISKSVRLSNDDCTHPTLVDSIVVVPKTPLDPDSTYSLAILDGLRTAGGQSFGPAFVWGLVRQTKDPVTVNAGCDIQHIGVCKILANHTPISLPTTASTNDPNLQQLVGIHSLWFLYNLSLPFLDTTGKLTDNRGNLLGATDFNTQSSTKPLDPTVATSPAATLSDDPLTGTVSVPTAKGAPCDPVNGCKFFMSAVLGSSACTSLPCTSVGDIFHSNLSTTNYQVLEANAFAPTMKIPGTWSDPQSPVAQSNAPLTALSFIPNGTPPSTGWPTIVFGHGLGSSKESLFAIAAQFAQAGFASIAIDFQAHGSRAVPTSSDAALGCAGTCKTSSVACDTVTPCAGGDTCVNGAGTAVSSTTTQQCYAAFVTTNLAATRDNIRQTVLDMQRLVRAIRACGATGCASANNSSVFSVNPDSILYTGISLGGIIGTTTVATSGHFKAGVLNVPAVGLVDVLENTETPEIKCPLVNALIDLGFLSGKKWDGSNFDALCFAHDWPKQPSYGQFALIARWLLDPADGANYLGMLSKRRFMIQEVVNDQVVPNVATDAEGELLGLSPGVADLYLPPSNAAPSAAISGDPAKNLWIRYPTLPPDPNTSFPGNTYEHSSLLRPSATSPAVKGQLGTARMQTDAIFFLSANK